MAPKRKFYRVNFGFRSLIDWASTKSVSGPQDPTARNQDDQPTVVHRGPSNLKGPYSFAGGGRPLEDQMTTGRKIPGHDGAYWDIMYFNRPSLAGHQAGAGTQTREMYLRNIDVHAQQWIYLAAEKAALEMHNIKEEQMKGKTEKQKAALEVEYNNLLKFFGNDDEATKLMGVSMSKNTFPINFDEQLYQIREQMYISPERVHSFTGIGPARSHGSTVGDSHTNVLDKPEVKYEYSGSSYKRVDTYEPLQRHYMSMRYKEDVPMQMKQMMAGLTSGKSWINAFSRSMDKKGKPYMMQLARYVDEFIQEEAIKIGEQMGLSGAGRGVVPRMVGAQAERAGRTFEKKTYERGMSAGGPVQERASVAAGVAESPSDKVMGHQSKPIDVKFIREAGVNIGSIKGIRDFDLTKSLYGADGPKGHHGTIPGMKVSEFDSYKKYNKRGLEKDIKKQYKETGGRLDQYNNIMRIIIESTTFTSGGYNSQAGDPKRAREAIGKKGKVKDNFKDAFETTKGKGGHKFRAGKVRAWARAVSQANDAILREAGQGVANMTRENLYYTLEWVLHHMGQEVIPETYGNMMGILLPDNTLGTLLIGFKTDADGYYTDVEVSILDDITPIQWLYQQALIVDSTLSLDAFLEGGNIGIAMHALEGGAQIGALSKFANLIKASGFTPRISMGRLSEPKFSKQLENVMSAVFSMMGQNISKELNKQIKDDAVRFSKVARHPSQLGTVGGWYVYAWKTMLGLTEFPSNLGTDPYWFLWAAPYVSGEYPQGGGGKQEKLWGE